MASNMNRATLDDQAHLLAPSTYDDDAHSVSGLDSDSEDDHVLDRGLTSTEIARHDREVLEEEEELERLLTGGGIGDTFGRVADGFKRVFSGAATVSGPGARVPVPAGVPAQAGSGHELSAKEIKRQKKREKREQRRAEKQVARAGRRVARDQRKEQRRQRRRGKVQGNDVMFEMEEGVYHDDFTSESSDSPSKPDIGRHGQGLRRKSRLTPRSRFFIAFAGASVLFLLLLFGAWRMSRKPRVGQAVQNLQTFSNGTALFGATTILVSLDGFRADFLNRGLTPTLNSFIANGISPRYMLPSFPSLTFPNHFTLVTGLYPESHGIVGNTFWDPDTRKEFWYTDPARSLQPEWWQGEPVWVTAEKQGIRSAVHMWPGSEAHIEHVDPEYYDRYNGAELLSNKVNKIFQWLDKPGMEDPAAEALGGRPQLIQFYVPVVDTDGHKYGPNSTEIRTTIKNVDDMLGDIFMGIEARNLTDIVNIIIVSDHGMATTSTDRLIQLDDLIDLNLIEHIDGWPLYGLRPKDPKDLQPLYEKLSAEAAKSPNFDVYLRDKDMPERYHFSKHNRIAPLWIVPKTGWAIVTRNDFDVQKAQKNGDIYHPRGLHGYDFEHPLMRAIFVARGPAFPHKPNSRVQAFQNTEVYNIVCDTLGLEPRPNNGTLRLPLKPVGLHSDPDAPQLEEPNDPPAPVEVSKPATEPVALPDPATSTAPVQVDPPEEDGDSKDGDGKTKLSAFWTYLISKIDAAKSWASSLFNDDDPELDAVEQEAGDV